MRWKRVLLVGAIAVAVGAVGAGGALLFTYHQATKIDRSQPKVVLSEYLRAALVRRDAVGADLYSCKDREKLAPIRALREELDRRESDFDVAITVSWGAHQQTGSEITTTLTITARKGPAVESTSREPWRFTVVEEDGWRVCGAEKLEANPT